MTFVERKVRLLKKNRTDTLMTVEDLGVTNISNETLKIEIYQDGKSIGWVKADRQDILDLFVSLWPENVAYQFDSEDHD